MKNTISYLPPMGATKTGEYYRTIEMIENIFNKHGKRDGVYYVLAFLYDSGYDRKDISKMMDLCKPKPTKQHSINQLKQYKNETFKNLSLF